MPYYHNMTETGYDKLIILKNQSHLLKRPWTLNKREKSWFLLSSPMFQTFYCLSITVKELTAFTRGQHVPTIDRIFFLTSQQSSKLLVLDD